MERRWSQLSLVIGGAPACRLLCWCGEPAAGAAWLAERWLAAWPLAELDGARPDGWGVGVWGCEAEKNKKKTQKVKVKDQHMMRATGTKVGMSGTIGTG
jgi:hypothetical protein